MKIRASNESDLEPIRLLHLAAFGEEEGEAVSTLVMELLQNRNAKPVLSLVAEKQKDIVGHVLFTPISVENSPSEIRAHIMAPLAVAEAHQRAGIGTELIKEGLTALKASGTQFVMVLGDPNYYQKSGFHTGHQLETPYAIDYPEAWMAIELKKGALDGVKGKVLCVSPLDAPEYW